jgi:hypothetical protein
VDLTEVAVTTHLFDSVFELTGVFCDDFYFVGNVRVIFDDFWNWV